MEDGRHHLRCLLVSLSLSLFSPLSALSFPLKLSLSLSLSSRSLPFEPTILKHTHTLSLSLSDSITRSLHLENLALRVLVHPQELECNLQPLQPLRVCPLLCLFLLIRLRLIALQGIELHAPEGIQL